MFDHMDREDVAPNQQDQDDALKLAILFHETYERLAPSFGYETRNETKTFDPSTPNGKLMVAVCAEILAVARAETEAAQDRLRHQMSDHGMGPVGGE